MTDISIEMHPVAANVVRVKVEFEMNTMAFDDINFWQLKSVQQLIAKHVAAGRLKSLMNIANPQAVTP